MKIDKKALDKLSCLPDDSLWKMVCSIGHANGLDLSGMNVSPQDMTKLRSALGQVTDEDISRALEILSSCKKHGK